MKTNKITEDVESDHNKSRYVSKLATLIQTGVKSYVDRNYFRLNSNDYVWKTATLQSGNIIEYFRLNGRQIGLPDEYEELEINLLPKKAVFYQGAFKFGKVKAIQLSVLPEMDKKDAYSDRVEWLKAGVSELQNKEWHSIILHEWVHALQYKQNTLNLKGSDMNTTDVDYFNSPDEFDAHYHEIMADFHEVLQVAREDKNKGIDKATEYGINDNMLQSLLNVMDRMPEFSRKGIHSFIELLKTNRYRRLMSRIYQTHKAIIKELTMVNENDEEHQKALDDTGFWGKAGAGCIILAMDTGRFLLPYRSAWVEQPHTWGTWGGAIDGNEDPKKAAMREVEEEAGYTGRVLGIDHLYQFKSGSFRYDTFLVKVATEFKPNLNWETEKAEWFSLDDLPAPIHFGLQAVLDQPGMINKLASAASK